MDDEATLPKFSFPETVQPDVLAMLNEPPGQLEGTSKCLRVKKRIQGRHGSCPFPNVNRETHLRNAASTNNLELLEFYLQKGTNPNSSDHYKRTPLHLAASRGYIEIINMLIQYGADPNARDMIGNTPLHLSSCQGGSGTTGLAVIKALLQAGTKLDSTNSNGNNPLDLAKSKLRILLGRSQSSSGTDQSLSLIISDFQDIVDLMIHYQRANNGSVDDLTTLASRIASLNTQDDVKSEIATLLDQIDSLKL